MAKSKVTFISSLILSVDSLWEEKILGLSPGIRGISAATLNNVFGKNMYGQIKKMVKFFNKDFPMDVIKIKK